MFCLRIRSEDEEASPPGFDFEGFWDDCEYSLKSYAEPAPAVEVADPDNRHCREVAGADNRLGGGHAVDHAGHTDHGGAPVRRQRDACAEEGLRKACFTVVGSRLVANSAFASGSFYGIAADTPRMSQNATV
jgi:hypothetical protein